MYFIGSNNAFIANCWFDNPTNIRVSSSTATLNSTIQSGTNIIGGPYIGGNLWLTDPAQNISEWGTEGEYPGICNESLEIPGFGTDHHPLKFNQTADFTPTADFTLTPTRGTAPLSVRFTDTSTGAATAWNWSFGDGATSTDQDPVHTYTAAGTYTVTLNASNAYGWNITTKVGAVTVTSSDGGGSGGGGGRSSSGGITPASPSGSEPGQSTETGADVPGLPATITAPDGGGVLTIPDGVVALDASGVPLQEIVITPMNTVNLDAAREVAEEETSAFYFGQYAYRVEPDGATFDPPITLTFNVPIEIWETLDAENVAVMWQGPDGVWETVPIASIERSETHVLVSAAISHFSVYSLFMPRIVQETPVAPPTAPTIPWVIWVVIPLIAIGIILYLWRMRTTQVR